MYAVAFCHFFLTSHLPITFFIIIIIITCILEVSWTPIVTITSHILRRILKPRT